MFKEVTIEALDGDLRGLFEAEFADKSRQVAVPGAVVGDVLDIKIAAISQHHPKAYGEIARVHRRGPDFEAPPCPHAAPLRGRCGGCPAMHLSPQLREQAKFKAPREYLDPLGAEITWRSAPVQQGYRNRSNFVVRRQEDQVVLGSFAPRSNAIAAMTGCLAVRPAIAAVHRQLETLLTARQVPVDTDQGALRWVSIREAQAVVVV